MTELVVQVEDNALLPSLRKVITALNGVGRIMLSRRQPAVSPSAMRLLNDLAAFQSYKKGWDGGNASPLSQQVAKHFLQLLSKCTEDDLRDWCIYLEKNGTLILENARQSAQINLADKEFSFFKADGHHTEGESHVKYSIARLQRTVRLINE